MTTLNQGIKTFNQRRATEAALTNEQVTRQRVDRLELWFFGIGGKEPREIDVSPCGVVRQAWDASFGVDRLKEQAHKLERRLKESEQVFFDRLELHSEWLDVIHKSGFWGRIKWLFLGR